MADKTIGDLNNAPGTIDDSNTLFVVQQNGTAYKLNGHAFILALTNVMDGHGGISSITYTEPVPPSLEGTMTIAFADRTSTTLEITNGKGVVSETDYWAVSSSGTNAPSTWYTTRQSMTVTNKYLWHYKRTAYNDGTTADTIASVVGVYGDTGNAWYVWIRYAGRQPTSNADIGTDPDKWMGVYSGTSATAPTSYTEYNWFEIKGETGETGDPAYIASTPEVVYQASSSGTVTPSGAWSSTPPNVNPGQYLWTRTMVEFNTGSPVIWYSVAYHGINGSGATGSVNNVFPDLSGNVSLAASDIPTSDSSVSIQQKLTALDTAVGTAQTTAEAKAAISDSTTGATTTWSSTKMVSDLRPRVVTLSVGTTWTGTAPYTQEITVTGGTAATKVDIQPDYTVIQQMATDGCTALYVTNNNGTFTINAVDSAPSVALSIQAMLTEVT